MWKWEEGRFSDGQVKIADDFTQKVLVGEISLPGKEWLEWSYVASTTIP